jgi:hypothetical protein
MPEKCKNRCAEFSGDIPQIPDNSILTVVSNLALSGRLGDVGEESANSERPRLEAASVTALLRQLAVGSSWLLLVGVCHEFRS